MKWVFVAGVVYALGFAGVLAINVMSGPVTPGLSLVRAVVWPLWVLTGRPAGYREPMD